MAELKWIETARKDIGIAETGKKTGKSNPKIIQMWKDGFNAIGQGSRFEKEKVWHTDATYWCSGFVAYVLSKHDDLKHHIPKSFPMARSWANAGTKLKKPAYGSIAVFSRAGGGHVGFVVGQDNKGNLLILGGNQGDKVCITPISKSRLLCCVWCGTQKLPNESRYNLTTINHNMKTSTNET